MRPGAESSPVAFANSVPAARRYAVIFRPAVDGEGEWVGQVGEHATGRAIPDDLHQKQGGRDEPESQLPSSFVIPHRFPDPFPKASSRLRQPLVSPPDRLPRFAIPCRASMPAGEVVEIDLSLLGNLHELH